MQSRTPNSLNWPEVLTSLRACTGEVVLVRDGRVTEPGALVRTRSSAKGTELCLFPGEVSATRLALIQQLETLAKGSGRRFMSSARAKVGESYLLIESVADESIDGALFAVVKTRRPKLGFNQSQQIGSTTTLRSKRIKTG
jgi:hypothetical protein